MPQSRIVRSPFFWSRWRVLAAGRYPFFFAPHEVERWHGCPSDQFVVFSFDKSAVGK